MDSHGRARDEYRNKNEIVERKNAKRPPAIEHPKEAGPFQGPEQKPGDEKAGEGEKDRNRAEG